MDDENDLVMSHALVGLLFLWAQVTSGANRHAERCDQEGGGL
jgi:hypothetical protein